MSALVVLHVALRSEALPAPVLTSVGALVAVNSDVRFQILLLTERLVAAKDVAAEWLCATVRMHVGLHPNLTCKALGAARELANEQLFLIHAELLLDFANPSRQPLQAVLRLSAANLLWASLAWVVSASCFT